MTKQIAYSRWFQKFTEIVIPVLTWVIITFPLWFSPFHPAVVAYFIIAFDLYFFYKAISTVYYAGLSYRKILLFNKINFVKKIGRFKQIIKVKHFVIIPNYQEPLYKLQSTIQSIIDNKTGKDDIYLVLAFEKREETQEKYLSLKKQFGVYFNNIIPTYHPLMANEAPGKASNQTHAARIIDRYCIDNKIESDAVLVTVCDADSHLPGNYFSYLTYRYLADKDRRYHFYCGPVLLYNNFWQLPFFVRIQSTISSILRLAFLSFGDERLIQISTYSTNLWLLKTINFWDVDIIPEDWHIYLQAFFKFGTRVKTLPLFTIINGDAVYSGHTVKTSINRYEQERRWAWGATDISYALRQLFLTPRLPFWPKLKKILFLSETHLLWTSSFFILTLSASVPPLINPLFKKTVLGFILPQLSGLILTLSSSMLLIYVYLDFKLRQKMKVQTRPAMLPLMIIQWYFLPLISFFLSSLPALDAHTRMLFGKKITYKVTQKV